MISCSKASVPHSSLYCSLYHRTWTDKGAWWLLVEASSEEIMNASVSSLRKGWGLMAVSYPASWLGQRKLKDIRIKDIKQRGLEHFDLEDKNSQRCLRLQEDMEWWIISIIISFNNSTLLKWNHAISHHAARWNIAEPYFFTCRDAYDIVITMEHEALSTVLLVVE